MLCVLCVCVQVTEYEQLNKGQSRSSYTKRILEIVANIQKQKEDISRILSDTRKVCYSLTLLVLFWCNIPTDFTLVNAYRIPLYLLTYN